MEYNFITDSLLQKLHIITSMNFYTRSMIQAETNSSVSFVHMYGTTQSK